MTEEKEKQVWTIDELVAMTETVQSADIEYAGKVIPIQWCELTEAEEPKMAVPDDDTPADEVTEYYKKIAQKRVNSMLLKANEKNPEGFCINPEVWDSLPTTVRWAITGKILGGDGATTDFTSG